MLGDIIGRWLKFHKEDEVVIEEGGLDANCAALNQGADGFHAQVLIAVF